MRERRIRFTLRGIMVAIAVLAVLYAAAVQLGRNLALLTQSSRKSKSTLHMVSSRPKTHAPRDVAADLPERVGVGKGSNGVPVAP
jgi:hypothetical protein